MTFNFMNTFFGGWIVLWFPLSSHDLLTYSTSIQIDREVRYFLSPFQVSAVGDLNIFFLPGPLANWARNVSSILCGFYLKMRWMFVSRPSEPVITDISFVALSLHLWNTLRTARNETLLTDSWNRYVKLSALITNSDRSNGRRPFRDARSLSARRSRWSPTHAKDDQAEGQGRDLGTGI